MLCGLLYGGFGWPWYAWLMDDKTRLFELNTLLHCTCIYFAGCTFFIHSLTVWYQSTSRGWWECIANSMLKLFEINHSLDCAELDFSVSVFMCFTILCHFKFLWSSKCPLKFFSSERVEKYSHHIMMWSLQETHAENKMEWWVDNHECREKYWERATAVARIKDSIHLNVRNWFIWTAWGPNSIIFVLYLHTHSLLPFHP